jgi:hypothetical protein
MPVHEPGGPEEPIKQFLRTTELLNRGVVCDNLQMDVCHEHTGANRSDGQ